MTECGTIFQKLCENENCNVCFNKSFASSEKAIFWHPDNSLKPRQVFKNSHTKYKFMCNHCQHIFDSSLNHISKGKWCPYCCKTSQKLCENEKCNTCYNNSFASHEKSKFWSINNTTSPRNVIKGSGKKYYFNCSFCLHEFAISLGSIIGGSFCCYCARKKLCENINCSICFKKSFASHENSKYMLEENNVNPRYIFKNSIQKFKFRCYNCGNIYISSPHKICGSNAWCNCTFNKTETKLYNHLSQKYAEKFNVIYQKRLDFDEIKKYPFDFYIDELETIIELDGRQHFEQVRDWTSPEIQCQRDEFKMKYANDLGYCIIRIFQEDVYSDKTDWKKDIEDAINKIINDEKTQNIFIGEIYNDKFEKFKNL